jgi:hypothetical protein
MSECPDCKALSGQPASVDPHPRLSVTLIVTRPEGEFTHYACRLCGTGWERFKNNERYRGPLPIWTRL